MKKDLSKLTDAELLPLGAWATAELQVKLNTYPNELYQEFGAIEREFKQRGMKEQWSDLWHGKK